MRSKIIGYGHFIPSIVTNQNFITKFGKKAWILSKKLPHESRFLSLDLSNGNILYSGIDMAVKASRMACKVAKIDPKEIDTIVYSSATHDYILPPSSTAVQRELNIESCSVIDIKSGCSGFGSALMMADALIKTGVSKITLVIGAELSSSRVKHIIHLDENLKIHTLLDMMMFGDGAGVLLLTNTEENEVNGIVQSYSKSNFPYEKSGSEMRIGGGIEPFPVEGSDPQKWAIVQDNKLSEKMLAVTILKALKDFEKESKWNYIDYDYFVIPVESQNIIKEIQKEYVNINSEKIISIGKIGGALANAAVPMAISEAMSKNIFKKGDKILVITSENTQWQVTIISLIW